MRTLKFKITSASQGRLVPTHPAAEPGWHGSAITYAITEVPDNVSLIKVQKLANDTAMIAGYTFKFTDLGKGRIVRGS